MRALCLIRRRRARARSAAGSLASRKSHIVGRAQLRKVVAQFAVSRRAVRVEHVPSGRRTSKSRANVRARRGDDEEFDLLTCIARCCVDAPQHTHSIPAPIIIWAFHRNGLLAKVSAMVCDTRRNYRAAFIAVVLCDTTREVRATSERNWIKALFLSAKLR